ncbi:NADH-quinone oxidoreductase subunit A [Thermoflexus sp.]|uniref:NADH-quinone oxidoreductase subunit A n=1 Tax=Thermoflexus sp. TaxID=1969742 RepID=UPI0025D116BB|nr:NADH-quinone oxidoreductase subunit A [Thermoflexus sp.]MDW8179758.1 NADH-quinone oxidoreductase subunit A [Anaerolineae bacterium]MDW8184686.1 NADH-quinone oxidoreductase subunit A [Anaerolineae bacterium]
MLQGYAVVGLYLLLSFALLGVVLLLWWFLRPKKPNPLKLETYECGVQTVGDAWVQFRAQYYIFALIFVLFDVEAVFLFPWAVAYNQLGLYAVIEMALFLLLLLGGLLYAWRKGALEWA